MGINETIFLGPNRGYGYPIFGVISGPISERLKCDKNEASLAEIRVEIEGLLYWRRIARDFPRNFRESRTNRWELTGPSFWTLIAAKDIPFPTQPSAISGRLKCATNEAPISAIRGQKDGRPDWWWIGHDPPMISHSARTDHWELTKPPPWALIAAKDSPFSVQFPARYRSA